MMYSVYMYRYRSIYTSGSPKTQSYEFVEVTSDDNGDDDKQRGDKRQKTKKLASRSKAARDFGTAWRAGMAAVRDVDSHFHHLYNHSVNML
jgi:hypothetical protein